MIETVDEIAGKQQSQTGELAGMKSGLNGTCDADWQQQHIGLRDELERVKSSLQSMTALADTTHANFMKHGAQLAGLEVRTNGMLGEMDALVLKAKATEKRVKAADDALTETCSKQAAQAAESAELCKQLEKVRRQLSALSEERRNDSELLGCIRGDLVPADTALETVGVRLDATELGARSLGEKFGAVEGGLDRARAAESSWTEQLNAARTKLRDLSNQLETVDSLAQAVSHLRTEMPQARVDLKLEIDKLRSHGNEVTDKLKLHIEGRLGSVEDGATPIAGNYRRAFSLFPCASATWPTLCRRLIALRFRHKRRSAPS
jgi:chromosome segregation ATPase